jgi:hypothetical protein
MLASKYLAISHGHMDHIGGLAYFCSQRRFQGMGNAKIVCDERIAPAIRGMMAASSSSSARRRPTRSCPLEPEGPSRSRTTSSCAGSRPSTPARAFGYTIVEKRSKLKPEFAEYPQEKLRELKDRGVEITRTLEIPLIAYLGDTPARAAPGARGRAQGPDRDLRVHVLRARPQGPHAKVGMHMHVDDIAEWMRVLECQNAHHRPRVAPHRTGLRAQALTRGDARCTFDHLAGGWDCPTSQRQRVRVFGSARASATPDVGVCSSAGRSVDPSRSERSPNRFLSVGSSSGLLCRLQTAAALAMAVHMATFSHANTRNDPDRASFGQPGAGPVRSPVLSTFRPRTTPHTLQR